MDKPSVQRVAGFADFDMESGCCAEPVSDPVAAVAAAQTRGAAAAAAAPRQLDLELCPSQRADLPADPSRRYERFGRAREQSIGARARAFDTGRSLVEQSVQGATHRERGLNLTAGTAPLPDCCCAPRQRAQMRVVAVFLLRAA